MSTTRDTYNQIASSRYNFRHYSRFQAELDALGTAEKEAVRNKIKQIRRMPWHFEFLHNTDRMQKARAGKYRIIFRVEGAVIQFLRVAKRDSVYQGMV